VPSYDLHPRDRGPERHGSDAMFPKANSTEGLSHDNAPDRAPGNNRALLGGRGHTRSWGQAMNRADPGRRLGKEVQDDEMIFCPTCASRPRLIISILDSRKGRTVRMFECRCGEVVWDD
jgi:hypothetical protein